MNRSRKGLITTGGILLLLLFSLGAEELYPGKIITVYPEFSSGLIHSPCTRAKGAELQGGILFSGISDQYTVGINGGFHYLKDRDQELISFPSLSLRGGYIVSLFHLFQLNPYGEFSLLWPIEDGSVSLVPSAGGGVFLNFHLYKANYLSLSSSVSFPLSGPVKPYYSLQLGLKYSIPLMINVPPAELFLTLTPFVFSPDGDTVNDTMIIRQNIVNPKSVKKWTLIICDHHANPVYSRKGRGAPPETILWDGYSDDGDLVFSASDYDLRVSIEDKLGNIQEEQASFMTDIFVQNEEGQLKIRIPGIVFSPGKADFTNLSELEKQKNREIISRLSEILEKFPDYRILIEGHGNLLNWSSQELSRKEQTELLIPLSRARAEAIRDSLIEKGIREERLDVVGRGGDSPLVPFADEENRWKNRRVEFILLK